MTDVIALVRCGRYPAGTTFQVNPTMAKALVALRRVKYDDKSMEGLNIEKTVVTPDLPPAPPAPVAPTQIEEPVVESKSSDDTIVTPELPPAPAPLDLQPAPAAKKGNGSKTKQEDSK